MKNNFDEDIRWKQRFENYKKALSNLDEAVFFSRERSLSNLEHQGLIQAFEFTFELAWKLMKDYLNSKGIISIIGSKDSVRHAFQNGLLLDAQIWMSMIEDRNKSSHTYNDTIKDELVKNITEQYHAAFEAFEKKMEEVQ